MITGLCDEYPTILRKNREIFVGVLILFIYLCALPTTTYVSSTDKLIYLLIDLFQGGNYIVQFLDKYGIELSILFVVFVETIAVCWCYGQLNIIN